MNKSSLRTLAPSALGAGYARLPDKMNSHILILCLTALPSVVIAQAPGDGDSFCTSNIGVVAPPVPVNARILMDSFSYIRLLSSQTGAAWQQVDVDGIQSQGRGATWFQSGDNACRQTVTACGFRDGVQDNWLITQFINRTTVDGTRLPQVSIQIEFEQEGCVEGCSRISSWYGYETSTINSVAARNTSNYVLISRLVPNDGNLQNQTRFLNFTTNESGFYLAIRDEDTCLAVTRVLVFYNICPQETVGLMIRPETLSPPITTPSQEPLRVTGQCVANAGTESGAAPSLTCSSGGKWSVVSGCQCNQGSRATENGTSCTEACMAGTYLSMTYGECRNCPENSVGVAPGLVVCPCVEGYYRTPGEEDLSCTLVAATGSTAGTTGNGGLSDGATAGIAIAAVVAAVIAFIIIVVIICICKKAAEKSSKDDQAMTLREGNNPSDTPASNNATPEGDLNTEVSRDKKPDRPEDHLPTYQAPDTIKCEAAGGGAGGELYTVVDKPKKGGKKANDKSEDDISQMYAMPDKSKKKQNQDQGVVYADIEAGGQPVRRPAPAPQRGNTLQQDTGSVTYSTVQSAM